MILELTAKVGESLLAYLYSVRFEEDSLESKMIECSDAYVIFIMHNMLSFMKSNPVSMKIFQKINPKAG